MSKQLLRMISAKTISLFALMIFAVLCSPPISEAFFQPDNRRAEPRIHDKFRFERPEQLSPPLVRKPIHECADVVHVFSFIPHAVVEVYANGTELIGKDQPWVGFADIKLYRPLKLGEKITATQTVFGMTSVQSYVPVVVTPYPALTKPEVAKDLFECGVIVPVGNLIESTTVVVYADGVEIGKTSTPGTWQPVWTQKLQAGQKITAQQVACLNGSGTTIYSPMSDPVSVKPEPNPLKAPKVDPASLIVGNDTVTFTDLYTGASLSVYDNGTAVGGGFATGSANWTPIHPPLTSTSSISGIQALCGKSPKSDPETPKTNLRAPIVVGPICAGTQFALIRNTVIGSTVVLRRNGSIVGYAGGVNGDLYIALGGNQKWNAGDVVTAVQYMGPTISPMSNSVTVQNQLASPAVEIFGGEGFFNAEQGEQQIDGPVFPRGKGKGPQITLQACCQSGVKAQILDLSNKVVADLVLNEEFPGYYSAQWNWKFNGNSIPATKIPVGAYTVVASSKCSRETARKRFYVIFDPAEVNGPSRFSFNETNIWFGSLYNNSFALVYHLHPDDARIFRLALDAASGQTDALPAAQKVADKEQALFDWTISESRNDTLDLLLNAPRAQCADDASMLTAMLRAIGIPAHTVTADAAAETVAGWNFDTWTEFLVPYRTAPEWLVLHPHQYPLEAARTRTDFVAFDSVRDGIATKSYNDLVFMAGENWVDSEVADAAPDITFRRQSCGEPFQFHTSQANWLLELCEAGYWTPNHWSCGGSGLHGLSIPDFSSAGAVLPGGSYTGRFTVTNGSLTAVKEEVMIELLGDHPTTKVFPDAVLAVERQRLEVAANGRAEFSFKLPVPRQIQPGHQILLRIRTAKETLFLNALKLQGIDVTVKTSDRKRVGDELTIVATIVNRSDRVLEGGRVALSVPPGVVVASPLAEVRALKPGERQEITWKAKLTAALEAGSIRVVITTPAQGWAEAVEPLSISDPSANAPAGVIR